MSNLPIRLSILCSAALLAACSATPPRQSIAKPAIVIDRDGAPPVPLDIANLPEPIPRDEPRARYGNHSPYTVFGERYSVLPDGRGYRERGLASWYGTKFHGRLTSTREPYDMYEFTAAHKTLPLPAYARVTNLENGRTLIVRINDRGPFHSSRIIDLSYAAAVRLGVHIKGTAMVEVETIDANSPLPAPDLRLAAADSPGVSVAGLRDDERAAPIMELAPPAVVAQVAERSALPLGHTPQMWLQLGAFGARENAEALRLRLLESGFQEATVATDSDNPATLLYRVKLGPLASADVVDSLNARLALSGFEKPKLVVR